MGARRRDVVCHVVSLVLALLHAGCGTNSRCDNDLSASAPARESQDPIDLASLLAPIHARHKAPALFGAIVIDDSVRAIGAVGVRQAGDPAAVTREDEVHIGSCTKAMTATLVGVLVDEGRLDWATTVSEVFAADAAGFDPGFRDVTVDQIMRHRAGLPRDLSPAAQAAIAESADSLPRQRHAIMLDAFSRPPDTPPGSTYVYSNQGYVILGHMVETVDGRPWEDVIRQRLFKPLTMCSAGFGPPGRTERLVQPRGHVLVDDIATPRINENLHFEASQAQAPAGDVHLSMADWGRFIALHLGRSPTGLLVSPATFDRLHIPPAGEEYAGGWVQADRSWGGGWPVLTHNGTIGTWYSVAWLAPRRGFAVLAVTNLGGDDAAQACDEASWEMIQYLQAQLLPPGQ